MNQLLAGAALVVLGSVLLIINMMRIRTQQKNVDPARPYFKFAGIAFILSGLYFLTKFIMSQLG